MKKEDAAMHGGKEAQDQCYDLSMTSRSREDDTKQQVITWLDFYKIWHVFAVYLCAMVVAWWRNG